MNSKHTAPRTPKSLAESICIFCFKNDETETTKGKRLIRPKKNQSSGYLDDGKSKLHMFFNSVQSYFEGKAGSNNINHKARRTLPPTFPPVPEDLKFVSCKDCFQIVESYNDTYHKIRDLELQLDKLLVKLENVMGGADEDYPGKNDQFNGWSRKEKGEVTKSIEFRRMFQKYCKLWMPEVPPKIALDHNTTAHDGEPRKRGRPRKKVEESKPDDDTKLALARQESNSKTKATTSSEMSPWMSELILKLSPPGSPVHDDDGNDWVADLENLSQCQTKRDPDWVDQPDNLSEGEDHHDEAEALVDSPSRNETDNDSDSDWDAEKDEEEERVPKKRAKRSHKKRLTNPKQPTSGTFECSKCHISPRPTFASSRLLQIHQNYLHTNGYYPLTKTDNTELLNLTELDLNLQGINAHLQFCNQCPKQFILADELTNHQNLHGIFTCDTCGCGTVLDYAWDMAHHVVNHIKSTQQNLGLLTCDKCPSFSTLYEGDLINHYLELHLNKPIVQSSCPICHQVFKNLDHVPFTHYLNFHDLTRLEDPLSPGIPCTKDDCSAYFLTEDQLQHHLSIIHPGPSSKPLTTLERKKEISSMQRRLKFMKYKAKDLDYSCEYCQKKFRGDPELRNHIWTKHADEKAGLDCGKIQLTEDGLTIDEFVIEEECVCKICEKVFTSADELDRHKGHHGNFKCEFCDTVKTIASELAVHETVHKIDDGNGATTVASVSCPRCPFSTKNRLDYIDHHLENHLGIPSDRKRCPICKKPVPLMLKRNGRISAKKRWMVSHCMEFHDKTGLEPDKISNCVDCGAHFRAPVQLHNHAKEIHGKLPHRECSDCGKLFKKVAYLRAHRISVHKVDESTFQFSCNFPECEHRFETQLELDYHEGNFHKEGDSTGIVVCPECGKKFVGSGQLTVHLRGHETQAKKEKEKAKKKEERLMIKKEKKAIKLETAVCDQCGKSFASKRLLQRHIGRHVDPALWKFVCSICGKKCPTRHSLTKHNRSHTGEKPYVCPVCGKAFSNSTNFKIHKKNKHSLG